MTAKGKINASKVQAGDRVIVKVNSDGTVRPSDTKTGEGVQIARVTDKGMRAAGQYEARGKYIVHTSAGSFEAAPIQTMWLAPEDAAGIKRAHVEALAEDKRLNRAASETEIQAGVEADQAEKIREAATAARQAPTAEQAAEIIGAALNLPAEQAAGWVAVNWSAPEEFTPAERDELAADFRTSGALDDAHAEALDEEIERGEERLRMVRVMNDATQEEAEDYLAEDADLPECPRCGGPLASDGVCADDSCGDEDEIHEGPLTLHSQAGKVDTMNETATLQARPATGSAVVALLEKVWARIRESHPELPEVVIVTGAGLASDNKWGHFRANGWKLQAEGAATSENMHEMFMAGETLAKGSYQVLQTMLHEGAHTLARVRDLKDTSRQGRWHNQTFKKLAEEMGLRHPAATADKTHGYSFVKLAAETKDRYQDLLDELDREINLVVKLPVWMGGEADQDGESDGGDKVTKPPRTEGAAQSGPLKATCQCDEPIIIRLSRKVLDMGVVRCDVCNELFESA